MGLDMYLSARKFLGFNKAEEKRVKALFPKMKGYQPRYVIFEVGYWRKANAIHNWFVNNCQDGKDDCKDYYVDRENLVMLRNRCQEVLDTIEMKDGKIVNAIEIHDLLPTKSGFFFGGTDYDDWYVKEVKDTIKIIDRCLLLSDDWTFEYQSSW